MGLRNEGAWCGKDKQRLPYWRSISKTQSKAKVDAASLELDWLVSVVLSTECPFLYRATLCCCGRSDRVPGLREDLLAAILV